MLMDMVVKMYPGEKLPSRHELCKRLDTSRVTLDKAIAEMEKEGILYAQKGSGTYINALMGETVPVTENWGLILPNLMTTVFVEITRAIENFAQSKGVNLILCNSDDDIDKQENYIRRLLASPVSGFIMIPVVSEDAEVNYQGVRAAGPGEDSPGVLQPGDPLHQRTGGFGEQLLRGLFGGQGADPAGIPAHRLRGHGSSQPGGVRRPVPGLRQRLDGGGASPAAQADPAPLPGERGRGLPGGEGAHRVGGGAGRHLRHQRFGMPGHIPGHSRQRPAGFPGHRGGGGSTTQRPAAQCARP